MPELPQELLEQLLDLIDRLRRETEDFLDQPSNHQVWYDRGYANGMLLTLQGLAANHRLGERRPDDRALLGTHLAMPWGRAYRHGEEMGSRETDEITGIQTA